MCPDVARACVTLLVACSWPGLASQLLVPVVPVEWRGAGSSSGTTGTQERVQAPWRRLATGQQGISGGSGGRQAGWLDTGRREGEGSGDKGTKRTKDKGRLEERYGQAALSERLLVDPEVVK